MRHEGPTLSFGMELCDVMQAAHKHGESSLPPGSGAGVKPSCSADLASILNYPHSKVSIIVVVEQHQPSVWGKMKHSYH